MRGFARIFSYTGSRAARAWKRTMASEQKIRGQQAERILGLVAERTVFTASPILSVIVEGMKYRIGKDNAVEIEISPVSDPSLKALLIVEKDEVLGVKQRVAEGNFKFRLTLHGYKENWTAEDVRDYLNFKYRVLAQEAV